MNMKKIVVLTLFVVLGSVFIGFSILRAKTDPKTDFLDYQRPPVLFLENYHDLHMESEDCLDCHHEYENGKNILSEDDLEDETAETSCESCHNNPVALGYGIGILKFVKQGKFGKWKFSPEYPASKYDGLPLDAWIPFLGSRKSYFATRSNVRPFNLEEQKNILTVGACLTCHKPYSQPMKMYMDKGKMPALSGKCVLPAWD